MVRNPLLCIDYTIAFVIKQVKYWGRFLPKISLYVLFFYLVHLDSGGI